MNKIGNAEPTKPKVTSIVERMNPKIEVMKKDSSFGIPLDIIIARETTIKAKNIPIQKELLVTSFAYSAKLVIFVMLVGKS